LNSYFCSLWAALDPLAGHVFETAELEGNVKPQTTITIDTKLCYTVKLDYNEKLDEFGSYNWVGLGGKINI